MRAVHLFVKSVTDGSRPAADGVDGVKSLAVALAVLGTAKCDKNVPVNYGGV